MSDSWRPHGLQPTRLLCPWDFSGKSTGAGAIAFSDIFPTVDEFNSDDHYVYYYGQESLRRNEVAIVVNKRVRNAVLRCNHKNDRMISVRFQGKPFNITAIQVYIPTNNAEETEVEQFFEDLQNLLELTPKKDVLFIGDWNAKVESQETPGKIGKFGLDRQNEAREMLTVLPREGTGQSKHPLPTTQEKTLHMDITRWSIPKSD